MTIRDMKLCSIDGCESAVLARGWCSRHYARWYHHGTTEVTREYKRHHQPGTKPVEEYAEEYAEFWAIRVEWIEEKASWDGTVNIPDIPEVLVGHRIGGPQWPTMDQPEVWGEFYRAIATDGGRRDPWARSQEEWDWERAEIRRAKREAEAASYKRYLGPYWDGRRELVSA